MQYEASLIENIDLHRKCLDRGAYVQVQKQAGLHGGRLCPVDRGLDVGKDGGVGDELGKVATVRP
tara:strand:+ start:2239 stop:2433 length:195 start_codon:yes stop_codon:yes gene_type:complete